ncbi:MAG: VCBS repeat-containing protein, partial [Tepidanaerobacter sp.]|nr:VCBS repeat-containing protein [Tepidanaerobacter sp.]
MRQAYQLEWASKDLGQESRVALGDVNGDGRINIIAGTTAASGHQSNLYVFQYRGNTYHQLARTSLENNDTHWLCCHDIDKDGVHEIIVG